MLAILITLAGSCLLLILVVDYWVESSQREAIYSYEEIEEVPEKKVGIIFGAGLDEYDQTKPSGLLADRVRIGVELYDAGKIQKLIMSGDNRTEDHDEPSAMIEFAKELGVPEHALQADYAGRRTYDTCLRAKKIFKLEEAILVTQDFHMARALYTCNNLGLNSVGVTSDLSGYEGEITFTLREYLATLRAVWDLNVDEPNDVVLGDVIEL